MSAAEWARDVYYGRSMRLYWALFRRRAGAKNRLVFHALTFLLNWMARRRGGYIGPTADIPGPVCLPHGLGGVYISRYAAIGPGCRIYQNVTVGEVDGKAPSIGANCLLGAGCVVIGDVRVGDGARIGAGAVVSRDVPPNCTVGVPAAADTAGGTPEMLTADPKGRAWIELDRAALAHNVQALRARLPEGCALMPAVKANAYGHGAVLIAGALQQLGIDAFCVATAEEGAELRQAGIRGTILILGCTGPGDVRLLTEYGLTQTAASADHAAALNGCGRPICVHIAVDTGMHRLGVPWDDTDALQAIFRLKNLRVDGLYTHLAGAGDEFTRTQVARFYAAADRLRRCGLPVPKLHLLSSYGVMRCPEAAGDYARPGIALYGAVDGCEELRPVLSLKARVTALRRLAAGEGAGYDLAFTARRDTTLAVVGIGYGDGLPRLLGEGRGRALINGRSAPIAGRICMDQCLVDVTGIPGAAVGTEAVFIGASGAERICAGELAAASGTICNEILSRLGPRLHRVWAQERA